MPLSPGLPLVTYPSPPPGSALASGAKLSVLLVWLAKDMSSSPSLRGGWGRDCLEQYAACPTSIFSRLVCWWATRAAKPSAANFSNTSSGLVPEALAAKRI